jgi:aminoglycoside phosphotransferase (APT) family kinase protein
MDSSFVYGLVLEAAPCFASVGLPSIDPDVPIDLVKFDVLTQCWGGMASIISVSVPSADSLSLVNFVAKCVRQSRPESDELTSIGDARKMQSYRAEAAFYQNGHVQVLLQNGCCVPRPLLVHSEHSDADFFVICMTRLTGKAAISMGRNQSLAALTWLARLHAIFWGKDRSDAAVSNGLQEQGGYWYLDTRQIELAAMPDDGWQGRLKMAARAVDWRLKNDPMLTIVHGDAKSANMLFDTADGTDRQGFVCQMMDFQYMGRASAAKDLAYALTCACDIPEEEESLLHHYHSELCGALHCHGSSKVPLFKDLQDSLALAYADLGRWMSGCSACPPPAADSPGFDARTGWGWWGNPLQDKIERLVLDKFVPEALLCCVFLLALAGSMGASS